MGLDPHLARQLNALELDPTVESFAGTLTELGEDIRRSVPSLCMVSMVLADVPGELSVELAPDGDRVRASLSMPVSDGAAPMLLVLRARQSGAFLLLADDLVSSSRDGRGPAVDQHLSFDAIGNAAVVSAALIDRRWMSIATGVLLAQGMTPDAAAARLQLLAEAAGVSPAVAARRMVGKWAPPDALDG